ncbi:MAG TPA: endonuclease domain-containing protein [Caulobacteraceae bacterium]|jgi:very-short-patch-repair endonuclease
MRSPRRTVNQARSLRGAMSRSEVLLWVRLRGREPGEPTFRRQHPIGPYIADFYCSATKLVIEIDGGVHREEDRMVRDYWRDEALRERGCRVLRIDARDVLRDPDSVADKVRAEARLPPPSRSA